MYAYRRNARNKCGEPKGNLPAEIGCIIMCVHAQLETYCSVTALFQPWIKNKNNYSDISCDEIKGKSTHTH